MSEEALKILTEISELEVDEDGDVILGADEYGVNETLIRIHQVLKTDKQLELQVFPMTEEGGLAGTTDQVSYWDILIRFGEGDPLHEFENLTEEERDKVIAEMQERYPFAIVDWGPTDLLQ